MYSFLAGIIAVCKLGLRKGKDYSKRGKGIKHYDYAQVEEHKSCPIRRGDANLGPEMAGRAATGRFCAYHGLFASWSL
jgi:hypothetical protein